MLKKIGKFVLDLFKLWPQVAGLVSPLVGATLSAAFGIIATTEQLFAAAYGVDSKKGSDKLRAAQPQIAQLILQTDLFVGKKPKDEALFQDATTRMTAALADVFNSFGD